MQAVIGYIVIDSDSDSEDTDYVPMGDRDRIPDDEHDDPMGHSPRLQSWTKYVSSHRHLEVNCDYETYRTLVNPVHRTALADDYGLGNAYIQSTRSETLSDMTNVNTDQNPDGIRLIRGDCCSGHVPWTIPCEDLTLAHRLGCLRFEINDYDQAKSLTLFHTHTDKMPLTMSFGSLVDNVPGMTILVRLSKCVPELCDEITEYLGETTSNFLGFAYHLTTKKERRSLKLCRQMKRRLRMQRLQFDLTTFISRHVSLCAFLLEAAKKFTEEWRRAEDETSFTILGGNYSPATLLTDEEITKQSTNVINGQGTVDQVEKFRLIASHTAAHVNLLQQVFKTAAACRPFTSKVSKMRWMKLNYGETGTSTMLTDMCHSLASPLTRKVIESVVFPLLHTAFEHITWTRWHRSYVHHRERLAEMLPPEHAGDTRRMAQILRYHSGLPYNSFPHLHDETPCPCHRHTGELQARARVASRMAFGPCVTDLTFT